MKYYVVEKSIVTPITADDAKKLRKDNVFYNYWKDEASGESVIIYDLDKNTCVPMIKFLMENPTQWRSLKFILFLVWWFLFFMFLLLYIIYSVLFSSSPEVSETPETPWIWSVVPISQNISSPDPVTSPDPLPQLEPQTETPLSEDLGYFQQDLNNRKEMISLTNDYQILEDKFYSQKQLLDESKEELRGYILEDVEKTRQLEEMQSKLVENNQLYLYLGEYVFWICENQPDTAKCKDLIFNFYNERK